jgi:hypothetical protein
MNRFLKFAGATSRSIAGYIVPDNAETCDDWRKDEEATLWPRRARRRRDL